MRTRIAATLAAIVSLTGAVAGCGTTAGNDDDTLTIVASFYPLQYVAERLAGEGATVTNLTRPGVEPHDLELTPEQVATVTEADLLVYLKGFQPAVDTAAAEHLPEPSRGYDVTRAQPLRDAPEEGHDEHSDDGHGHESHAKDPHLWLDPIRYGDLAQALARKLGAIDPEHKADYAARADTFGKELKKLDGEYDTGLADCQRREIVVSHAAFGYLTARYDLEQIAIAGLSPEQEPNPKRLAELADLVRKHGVTVIFYETLASPRIAETVADEAGVEAKPLDPLEGLKSGSSDDYFSVMRRNLASVRTALDCS
ncbi:MAG: metal ABC transporter substrate-binding protein [Micromonosporaceae bacterium]